MSTLSGPRMMQSSLQRARHGHAISRFRTEVRVASISPWSISNSTHLPYSTPSSKMEDSSMPGAKTSLSSEVEIPVTIVLELQCGMELVASPISNYCPSHRRNVPGTTHGLNGLGKLYQTAVTAICSLFCRIFRTDYGHSEVAAHFGNGTFLSSLRKTNVKSGI